MTAAQIQAEQALLAQAQLAHETILALITERDAYRNVLDKIEQVRFLSLTFEDKFDRVMEITTETLKKY